MHHCLFFLYIFICAQEESREFIAQEKSRCTSKTVFICKMIQVFWGYSCVFTEFVSYHSRARIVMSYRFVLEGAEKKFISKKNSIVMSQNMSFSG